MENQQLKPNFTPVPNLFFDTPDLMRDMSKTEILCLMKIWRQTYGWHKDRDKISNAQFVKFAGAQANVRKALKRLQEKGIIICTRGKESWDINQWEIDLTFTPLLESSPPPLLETGITPSTRIEPPPSTRNEETQKKDINKIKTNNKKTEFVLSAYNRFTGKNLKMNGDRERQILDTLKNYDLMVIVRAIRNLSRDKWSIEEKRLGLDRITGKQKRAGNIERFGHVTPKKKIESLTDKFLKQRGSNANK